MMTVLQKKAWRKKSLIARTQAELSQVERRLGRMMGRDVVIWQDINLREEQEKMKLDEAICKINEVLKILEDL